MFISFILNDDINNLNLDNLYYKKEEVDNKISELQTSFQDGVTSIYDTLVGLGVTPNSNSLTDIIEAINTLSTNKYNEGYNAAESTYKLSFNYITISASGSGSYHGQGCSATTSAKYKINKNGLSLVSGSTSASNSASDGSGSSSTTNVSFSISKS